MNCRNCGIDIVTSESMLCNECWNIAIKIQGSINKEKLELSLKPTSFTRWKTFLENQGIEFSNYSSKGKVCLIWSMRNKKGKILSKIFLTFNPNGSLYKGE